MSSLHQYNDWYRHYHNFTHIGEMMSIFNEIFTDEVYRKQGNTGIMALKTAILYHDVEYIPGAWDNEYRSAIIASQECGLPEREKGEVERLILLTKDHVTHDRDTLGKVIIDADLTGLASHRYEANSKKLRREFYTFNDQEWQNGRVAWLEKFLARPTIYLTDYGKKNWETDARFNMVLELNYLKGKISERTDS